MGPFLIILFAFFALTALAVKTVIFHHFKKFSFPGDPLPAKILAALKWGAISLLSLSFILLIALLL